jgi:hypothetical protein
MKTFILSLLGGLAMLSSAFAVGEPASELLPRDAVRLIAMRSGVLPNTVEISFIVSGKSRWGKDFEADHVRRVAAIHAVRENGSSSRRLVFYDLAWNETLGWFMWESRPERAGEAVYLWSELRGEIVNR